MGQWAQPQWPPRAPHMGAEGMAHVSDLPLLTPTLPGLESSLARFDPWHDGHDGIRRGVTNASNGLRQSRHSYSNSGIP